MRIGQKNQMIKLSMGVKNSKLSQVLGGKQSHNPRLDADTITKHNSPDGIIYNESNSNQNNIQPIKGISLPSHRNNVQSNRNSLEKQHRVHKSSENNHFT